jgi:hypothetical protein
VPAADRYQLRLLRDAGTLRTRVDPASGVFRMDVTVSRHYVEVETYEPAPDVSLSITRSPDAAPLYTLINRGNTDLGVVPWVWKNGVEDFSRCWTQGGRLRPRAALNLGWIDERCLLDGAKAVRANIGMHDADGDRLTLRQRTFVVQAEVRAGELGSRWIPDAGRHPWCACDGTEVGPEHEVVVGDSPGAMMFRARDGGVRVEQYVGPVGVGDHAPYVMPPGAANDPDFSQWR